ncbi:MAG: YiiD C-terminal domain-containing protein [Rhodospirillales bacterium]|nr:YiiD C-terminal domain-containing protein [Rhodospirillales bacterium]
MRLRDEGLDARVVIQENSMRYERPIAGTFTAVAVAPDAEVWARFVKTLQPRGRARISVQSELLFEGERAGWLEGSFVALGGETGGRPNG